MSAALTPADIDVVIPTIGRPSLAALLHSLATNAGPLPPRVLIVDDRAGGVAPLGVDVPRAFDDRVELLRAGGRGPAAARNIGWRGANASWVAFLDDDVLAPDGWFAALVEDLADLPANVAGSQGRIIVPLPADRPPTDWERNVAGLERARWATADMAYRRAVLAQVGGFDERFPRAYREDADLALRVRRAGYGTVRGRRLIIHPVQARGDWVSVRVQAGNADDPLMRALHGRSWRRDAEVPNSRRPWHVATATAGLVAVGAGLAGRRRTAVAATALWAALTADFAWRRIAPGPRSADEIRRMLATSAVLPLVAVGHWLAGVAALPWRLRQPGPRPQWPAAVIFDRDGTLVHDVPYNGDPARVRPVAGARAALALLRRRGIPIAVVSNQSGVGRGLLSLEQVDAVNRRLESLLGRFDAWELCLHAPEANCACRKPKPAMVVRACQRLGVAPEACVLIGDIGADMQAAEAAGALGVLVPTAATRPEEIAAAPIKARDLRGAVNLVLCARFAHRRAASWRARRAG